jgi:hypothetical protein
MAGHSRSENGVASLAHDRQSILPFKKRMDTRVKPAYDA